MAVYKLLPLLIVAVVVTCNSQSNTDNDSLSNIESALADISHQIANLDMTNDRSLTAVTTSLLQLTMLKELMPVRSASSLSSEEQEALDLLSQIEDQLNVTLDNQDLLKKQGEDNELAIVALQEEMSAMFSTVNSIKKDIKTIMKHTRSVTNSSYSPSPLPTSCSSIKSSSPDSPSGYYTIIDNDGYTRHVYCDMSELCGSSEGWTRVGHLNMTDPQDKCPDGFKLHNANGVRACGRQSSGCISTTFPSDGIEYSEVCGRVIGYQFGSPDGTRSRLGSSINSAYLDGISLTHGNPRAHIWSFINGVYQTVRRNDCPCGTVDSYPAQSFVGKHYFCESGANYGWQPKLYSSDPLWDGEGCGPIETPCCSLPGLPWFHRTFTYTTDDYIEMRICGDEVISNEDVPVSFYEIYVK